MSLMDMIRILIEVLEEYLFGKRFTGKILITFHCCDGSVGKLTSEVIKKVKK